MVAAIAANGLHGSVASLLDAAILLVQGAQLHSTPPAAKPVLELLHDLRAAGS
jgi:hypothetical protein